MHVYVYMNHFVVPLKLSQHCQSTVLQYKRKSYNSEKEENEYV